MLILPAFYTFRTSDIIQVINAALTYNTNFFADPQSIKNPFTNISFTNTELYSIYYSIKYSHYEMPFLFHQYLINGFSLIKFTYLNETMLREIAITDFCNSATNRQKYNYINKMLVEFSDIFCPSNIDPTFPKEKIVDTFNYLLKDTLTMTLSLITTFRKTSKQNIRRELREFKKYNPIYGRKLIVRKYKNIEGEPFIFGDKNRSFTIEYKYIDTVVTRKDTIANIPRKINTNRRAYLNRRSRLSRNLRRTRERTINDSRIRSASTPQLNSSEVNDYFSLNSFSIFGENTAIDTIMNTPHTTYNIISSGETDNETISSMDTTNETIQSIDEESSSDETTV